MLQNFIYNNPTTIYFGKDTLINLDHELKNYGKNILLMYGKGAIKKIGLYDEVISILKSNDKNIFELEGVMPNPTYAKLQEGAEIVRKENVDLILAVGGGSVIDCAKGIAVSAYYDGDAFKDLWLEFKETNHKLVPVASILTMVGTGSEMNGGSVITNEDLKIKAGRVFPTNVNPRFSILNPEYTYTISKYQMVSGIFDILSHLMEQYFSGTNLNTSDYLIEGLMASVIDNTRLALKNNEDYVARSNLMWTSSVALGGICHLSKAGDWNVHGIEHQLGAYTDCAHGMGLAAISLPYYRYIYKNGLDKFVRFATKIWGINPTNKSNDEIALAGIAALEDFINECGIISKLHELDATEEMLPLIAESTILSESGYGSITKEELLEILKKAY